MIKRICILLLLLLVSASAAHAQQVVAFTPHAAAGGASILDNLVSFYELEESSGTRVDAHGSNDLTAGGTPAQATGVVGFGQVLVDEESDYLQSSVLPVTGSAARTIVLFVNPTTGGGARQDLVSWGADSGGQRYTLRITFANDLRIEISGAGVNSSLSLATGSWHCVAAIHDGTSTLGGTTLYAGGTTYDVSSAATVNTSAGTDAGLVVGGSSAGLGSLNGTVDQVGIWSEALTTTQIDCICNAGSGRSYSALAGGACD